MNYQDYKHIIPIQIRFCDIDKLNHVNNSVYHNYIELGRVTYFKDVLKDEVNWSENGFILGRTEIDHVKQVHLNDDIYCCTKVLSFGNKSIRFKNSIVKKVNNEFIECAKVIGILVAMDYVTNTSITVPPIWKELMETFEK
ncbi:acyl-CoA thioesterase [Aurantibacillus circumpalustris]|uniref:acyl-CoA thioesterase n=1 Tax=Aurantibacillus circumpalustris TaxID=3036359 RepID=UPI00295A9DC9|nr:acyl-CoA thioesterase [Aurantibacillus circumpalustris]